MSVSTSDFTPWQIRKLRVLREYLESRSPRARLLRDEARALAFDEGRQEMLEAMIQQLDAEVVLAARNQARAVTVTFRTVAGRNWRGLGVEVRQILVRALIEYAHEQKLNIQCVDEDWHQVCRVRW